MAVLRTNPSSAVLAVVVGGLNGGVNSVLINWSTSFAGMPDSVTRNVVNSAVTGLMSGFMAGFLGVITYRRKAMRAAASAPRAHTEDHRDVPAPALADLSDGAAGGRD